MDDEFDVVTCVPIIRANSKSVAQLDPKSKRIIKTYPSLRDAARDHNVTSPVIARSCDTGLKTKADLLFQYHYPDQNKSILHKLDPGNTRKPVVQIDPDTGKILKEYESVAEASREYNIVHSVIIDSCNKKQLTRNGLLFQYANSKNIGPLKKPDLPLMIPCVQFPNYSITKDGRVYSIVRRKFRKLQMDSGYMRVPLATKNGPVYMFVHRLVAIAYIPNPNNLPMVNHKDGNTFNNHADNLEWVSHAENMRHARETGLNKGRRTAVYQKDIKTKEIIAKFDSITEARNKTGVDGRLISQACGKEDGISNGSIWAYVNPKGKKVEPKKSRKKPVVRINLETKEETKYGSIKEAAEDQGISASYLYKILYGNKHIKGYMWKIIEVDKTTPFEKLYTETRLWEKIHGHSDYRVSKDGRIFSDIKNLLMTPTLTKIGYLKCMLRTKEKNNDGKFKQIFITIHKAVVEAYIRPLKDKEVINHLNGKKDDNRLENLEITSCSKNILHAYDTGLCPKRKEVLQLDLKGVPIALYDCSKTANQKYKLSKNCIQQAILKKTTSIGNKWMYAKDYKGDVSKLPFYKTNN